MRRSILIVFALVVSLLTNAQNTNDDFVTFRQNMLADFHGFHKSVLDGYSEFLNGIWKDYEMFSGRKLHPTPKPIVQPHRKDEEPEPLPQTIDPQNVSPVEPVIEDLKPNVEPAIDSSPSKVLFDWCGMTMTLPDAKITDNLNNPDKVNLVAYLGELDNSNINKEVVPQITNIANVCNFNDWCIFLFVERYVKTIKANSNCNTRNVICWYILASLGYDVRLSLNGSNLFYLVPFQQIVYARRYININNKSYYIWGEGEIDENSGLLTPEVPDNSGALFNLVMNRPLNIPYKAKKYSHTFSGRTLSVEVNENLIEVMKHYPQMSVSAYAMSAGDTKMRNQVLAQMKEFVKGMDELKAANFILQFIQSFDYATDDVQFGYEKPFFIEEILYYPKCDCEDRSIFYHFLITHILGNSVHLVSYPNHECTAVHFSYDLEADHYMYQGKQYVICDPTYIGATIGMCMPDYKSVKPEIEIVE